MLVHEVEIDAFLSHGHLSACQTRVELTFPGPPGPWSVALEQ